MGSCRTPAVLLACLLTLLQPVRGWADPPPADLDRQAAVAWQRLEAVVDRYDATQERLRTTRAQLAGVNAQLVPLTDQLNRLQDRVGTLAAGLYVTTGTGPLDALLSARSPRALLDQLTTLDYLARSRARDVAALSAVRSRYEQQRRALTVLADAQSAEQSDLAAAKATIEGQLAQVQALRARAYGVRASRSELRDDYVPVFTEDAAGRAVRYGTVRLPADRQGVPVGGRRSGRVRLLRPGTGLVAVRRAAPAAQFGPAVGDRPPHRPGRPAPR